MKALIRELYHRYVRMGDWYHRGGKGVPQICQDGGLVPQRRKRCITDVSGWGTGTTEEERVYHRYVRMGDWYHRGGKGVPQICQDGGLVPQRRKWCITDVSGWGTGTTEEERVYHRYVRMGDWYHRGGKGVPQICQDRGLVPQRRKGCSTDMS